MLTSDKRNNAASVRPATRADLDALTRLGEGIQALHHHGRPDLFRTPDAALLRDFFEARLDDSHVLIAEVDGSPVGYLFAEHRERSASPFFHASSLLYIHHIAVAPDSRSAGVGTALVAAAADLAQLLGARAIRLDSWQFNEDAHDFFRLRGFQPINTVFEREL